MAKGVLSVIYIYYNTPKEIVDSINSLEKTIDLKSYEIIIVNNNSPLPLPNILKRNKNIKILENSENFGFGKAANQAAKISNGKYLLIINPDTIVQKNSIDLMIEKIKSDKKIGVLGPQLIDSKGKILHSIGSMPKLPDALFALSFINKIWPENPYSNKFWAKDKDRNLEQESDTVGGAVMLLPKKVFEKVGGFDERFFLYFEEADLCLRVKKLGLKIVYYPKAKIMHFVGRSSSNKKFIRHHYEKSRFRFFRKYYGIIPALLSEGFLRLPSTFKK